MNEELRKLLASHVESEAKKAKISMTPDRVGKLTLRLGDVIGNGVRDALQNPGDLAASCGSFRCPASFSCDWF